MEKIPEHRILKFHPDILEAVRKPIGLDKPGQIDAAIDILEDWIKKQAHFTKKDFSREYLERSIIFCKGSVERAKNQLDNYLTLKTVSPFLFEKPDGYDQDYASLHEYFIDAMLPELTKDNIRIYAGRLFKDGLTHKHFINAYQFATLLFEHLRTTEYCSGFVGILDYRAINMLELVTSISLPELNQLFSLITKGYHMRVKGIHLVTSSKAIELLVRLLKQVVSKKIGDRIYVHNTMESLHQTIPKELLPEEYGGEQKSLVELNKDWVKELGRKENVDAFKAMAEAKVIENLRIGAKPNDDILGVSGTFRTLCVD